LRNGKSTVSNRGLKLEIQAEDDAVVLRHNFFLRETSFAFNAFQWIGISPPTILKMSLLFKFS
jgi:hypothetical protein